MELEHRRRKLRLLLIGNSGAGKSTFGNFLLNKRNTFQEYCGFHSLGRADSCKGELDGTEVYIIDTPCLPESTDTTANETWLEEMATALRLASGFGAEDNDSGIDAVLYVMSSTSRFLEPQKRILESPIFNETIGGTDFWKYVIVVFSKSNVMGPTEDAQRKFVYETIESPKSPSSFKWLMEKASQRFVTVESVDRQEDLDYHRDKAKEMRDLIQQTLAENGYHGYKPQMFEKVRARYAAAKNQTVKDVKEIVRQQQRRAGDETCFPGNSTVITDHGSVAVEQVQLGDRVLCLKGNGKLVFSEVIAFLHYEPNQKADYLTIEAIPHGSSIVISANHLIFVATTPQKSRQLKTHVKPAGMVKPGDFVVSANGSSTEPVLIEVKAVHTVKKQGVFAPLTSCGTILVDGILASCYASVRSHVVAHAALAPLRLLTALRKHDTKQPKHGVHAYAALLHKIYKHSKFSPLLHVLNC